MNRLSAVLGVLAGLATGLIALAVLASTLGPGTVEPIRPTAGPMSSSTAAPGSPVATGAPTGTGPASAGPSGSGAAGSEAPGGSGTAGLRVGQPAPPLVVPQVGGGSIDLASVRGKPVWVAFTASWCPSCRDELAMMDKAVLQLGDRLAIVAVDVKEDPDTVATLVNQTGFIAPMGIDQQGTAQAAWNAYVLPMHFWIDGQGIVRSVLYGSGGPEQFQAGIAAVLPGATFKP
ncbi:MAG TPA: redoxin domain-containing protein [Candidatus Dormibacteraeota bacterium]|nr:redoxin domain-containing protein [Candidatus Dormibacteraeota bacterium]